MSDTYSLADMRAALGGNEDGMFGGAGYLGFLFLFFLFFLGRNNGIFGGNGTVDAGVVAPAATQQSVDALAARVDFDTLERAIAGNRDAIAALSTQVGASTREVEQAICGVNSAVERCCAQTNLSLCELGNSVERGDASIINAINTCCCQVKTEMLQGFNGIDKSICALGYNMQSGFSGLQNALSTGFSTLAYTNQANTNSIIQAGTANTQRIIDYLSATKEQDLRDKLNAAANALSQREQSDFIVAQLKNSCCNTGCYCN